MEKNKKNLSLKNIQKAILIVSLSVFLYSCATLPPNQPIIDSLLISKQYNEAISVLETDTNAYGKRNQLLYYLDKGMIEHLAGKYENSIKTFSKAQMKFDELYTKSISKTIATWVINDYMQPYHGEDFEHVMINIFQAVNYAMLEEYDEALVEARNVDSKLNVINDQYEKDQKNRYREDAFARFLMGVFYESAATKEDLNDAFIAYAKAEKIYSLDYQEKYSIHTPRVLKENILTMSRYMGLAEYGKFKIKFPITKNLSLENKNKKSEVYLIQYNGISPKKVEESIILPMLDGKVVKIAFPKYEDRSYSITASRLIAKGKENIVNFADSEVLQKIGLIAKKNLARRKLRLIAKSTLRATARYLVEKKQEKGISKKMGDMTAGWFSFFSNIYNVIVEQADLRCWQSLPDEIRIARLLVEPGEYDFCVENYTKDGSHAGEIPLGKVILKKGEKKFFILHTAR